MANNVDPEQTAPIGAVCSGSTLLASILNSSVMLGNYLQQTTSADDIFGCVFFLGALRVKRVYPNLLHVLFDVFSNGMLLGSRIYVLEDGRSLLNTSKRPINCM